MAPHEFQKAGNEPYEDLLNERINQASPRQEVGTPQSCIDDNRTPSQATMGSTPRAPPEALFPHQQPKATYETDHASVPSQNIPGEGVGGIGARGVSAEDEVAKDPSAGLPGVVWEPTGSQRPPNDVTIILPPTWSEVEVDILIQQSLQYDWTDKDHYTSIILENTLKSKSFDAYLQTYTQRHPELIRRIRAGQIHVSISEPASTPYDNASYENPQTASQRAFNNLADRNRLLLSRNTSLEAWSNSIEAQNTSLEARNANIEARNTALEARNRTLEVRIRDLEHALAGKQQIINKQNSGMQIIINEEKQHGTDGQRKWYKNMLLYDSSQKKIRGEGNTPHGLGKQATVNRSDPQTDSSIVRYNEHHTSTTEHGSQSNPPPKIMNTQKPEQLMTMGGSVASGSKKRKLSHIPQTLPQSLQSFSKVEHYVTIYFTKEDSKPESRSLLDAYKISFQQLCDTSPFFKEVLGHHNLGKSHACMGKLVWEPLATGDVNSNSAHTAIYFDALLDYAIHDKAFLGDRKRSLEMAQDMDQKAVWKALGTWCRYNSGMGIRVQDKAEHQRLLMVGHWIREKSTFFQTIKAAYSKDKTVL